MLFSDANILVFGPAVVVWSERLGGHSAQPKAAYEWCLCVDRPVNMRAGMYLKLCTSSACVDMSVNMWVDM